MKAHTVVAVSLFVVTTLSSASGFQPCQLPCRIVKTSPIGIHLGTSSRPSPPTANGFARLSSSRVRPGVLQAAVSKSSLAKDHAASGGGADESSSSPSTDPDRARRRQLLLSMLAAASTVPALQHVAAAETATVESSKEAVAAMTTTMIMTDEIHEVIKSPLDDRDYRTVILRSNGLRVLLCSDPSTNEAAVAMDVHVGATSDPTNVPGLAHFCEHMLFLGTKKVRQGAVKTKPINSVPKRTIFSQLWFWMI